MQRHWRGGGRTQQITACCELLPKYVFHTGTITACSVTDVNLWCWDFSDTTNQQSWDQLTACCVQTVFCLRAEGKGLRLRLWWFIKADCWLLLESQAFTFLADREPDRARTSHTHTHPVWSGSQSVCGELYRLKEETLSESWPTDCLKVLLDPNLQNQELKISYNPEDYCFKEMWAPQKGSLQKVRRSSKIFSFWFHVFSVYIFFIFMFLK